LRNSFEVDFYIPGESLIQVCYRFQEYETRKREIGALQKAAEKYPVKNISIISHTEEETITSEKLEINVIPAWKWLLKNPEKVA